MKILTYKLQLPLLLLLFFCSSFTATATDFSQHIHYNAQGPNTIGIIKIDNRSEEISQATFLYVKAALDYYKTKKPIFIILHLNTPGGEVFAAQRISDALKELDTQFNIPVVAYIDSWAISAGAMLAYSARYIVVSKDGIMGAAEPITLGTDKTETASEKVNSAIRTDFASRARFFDRNPAIAEAMVDKDVILVERNGEIIKVLEEKDIKSTDTLFKPKGKLLTLDSEQLMKYNVAEMLVPPEKVDQLTPEEETTGKWPAKSLLLFHQPFFKDIPQATIDVYQMDWKTRFFALLATPVVSSMLFLGLIVGFYMEINTPGFGLAGTIAITCLFLIILSSFAQEAASWLELIFLLAGISILLVELFVLPTFGLLGFIGIILFIAGLLGLLIPGIGSIDFEYDSKTVNAAGEFFFERLAWLSGALVLSLVIISLLGRYVVPRFSAFSRFVLAGKEQDAADGYTAAGLDALNLPKEGSQGIVEATLRPAGKVLINNNLYDAISDGGFIERGTNIVVVRLEGNKMVVDSIEKDVT